MIELRHMARVDLRDTTDEIKSFVLGMYCYSSYYGETFCNYVYKDGVALLPPNADKLSAIAGLLGEEIVDSRSTGQEVQNTFILQSGFNLRDYQKDPAERFIHHLKENKYGVLQAPCGAGKSTVVAYAAGSLNLTVLILLDQKNLIQSWQESFDRCWGKELQILKSSDTTFSECCVSTFQMLHKNHDLLSRIKNTFGVLVIDESHCVKATTFKAVLGNLNNAYRAGCTATPWVKNLPSGVISDFISEVSVKMVDTKSLIPKVIFVDTGVKFISDNPMEFTSKTTPALAKDLKRMSVVLDLMKKCLTDKRRTIITTITIEQAKMIKLFADKLGATSELYVGATSSKRDKEIVSNFESGMTNFLITALKVRKGVNIVSADVLISTRVSNNKADVIQITGRILRSMEGKRQPVIYDLSDSGFLAERFTKNRRMWYEELGYEMDNV